MSPRLGRGAAGGGTFSLLDGTLGTVPSNDGTTAAAQREMLRTSMTLHSAGSLLMELARLTSSVHVNGAASDPPQFMSNFARQHEQTMRREQQAQAAEQEAQAANEKAAAAASA